MTRMRYPIILTIACFLVLVTSHAVAAETSSVDGFGIQLTDIWVGCTTPPLIANRPNWRQNASFQIDHRDAQFLAVRFAWLRLPPGARVLVRDGQEDAESTGSGSATVLKGDHGVVYSSPLYTEHLVIEYTVSTSTKGVAGVCYGFAIDEYRFAARGSEIHTGAPLMATPRKETQPLTTFTKLKGSAIAYPVESSGGNCDDASTTSTVDGSASEDPSPQCVDGADGSLRVACVQYDSALFTASRAVARLLIHKASGSVFCTGWLLGSDGHVLTNHHCVASDSEANATAIEFLAQGRDCDQSCEQPMGCPGIVEATSAEIVASSPMDALDFTLLKPRLAPPQLRQLTTTYGFLSMRTQPPDLTERIFIPQHPGGYGKRVALKHGAAYGRVTTLTDAGCNARVAQSLGYMLATEGGSSGAPVVAYADKAVVGLHYCGGCRNSAIPARQILEALVAAGALPDGARV